MSETTGIEWTDSTFNPWWGCTKIAPACDFCYAAALDKRTGGDHWGNVPRRRTSDKNWNDPKRWQKGAAAFYEAHGRRRRVFSASMADIFDNQVDPAWRDDLWVLIAACPDMDWLLLTKRPQNIEKMKPDFWDDIKGHIWLGTTVEDQEHADANIPHLLKHDSAVRFLSCEPMVGPIDLRSVAPKNGYAMDVLTGYIHDFGVPHRDIPRRIDWVIAGGESGPNARVADPAWFRSLRDQCKGTDVPFLFKQWGNWNQDMQHVRDKKVAGRMLDGVTHDGYPR